MISFIRRALKSWYVLALLGLVVVAFAVTGVGDPFGGGGGGSLARVGDGRITEASFLKTYDRVVGRARETTPGLTPQQVAREGGVGQVLDQMAGEAALTEFARDNGIAVSERAVDGAIASIDAFRIGGKFDQATYQRLLTQRRVSERELRDGLRTDLLKKQLLVPVAAAAQVPRSVALPYARLLLDVHEGHGGTVLPPVIAPPTDAAIAAFYAANQKRFMTGERRAFRYALLDRDILGSAVAVSDAEVRSDYDQNKESYGGLEQRRLAQVVLPDAAKAAAFATAVRGGESFVAAAARLAGYKAEDTALGLLGKGRFAKASNAALANGVFAAANGAVVGPVKTDFGWNVVQVEQVVLPQGKSLTDLRGEITAKLRAAKAEAALADAVAGIEDGFAEGKNFAEMVKQYRLTLVAVPPVTRAGTDAAPAALPVVAKAFDVDPADGPSVQELGKGQFAVLELGQVTQSAAPPLAQVRPQVAAALAADQRSKAARAVADSIVTEVGKGTTLAAAFAKRGLAPPRPIRGRRIDVANSEKMPPAIGIFLTMAAGTTRALGTSDGSVVLLHVDRIILGDVATTPQILDATRQQLAQSAPEELQAAFGKAVERAVGVKIDQGALAAATRRIVGEGQPATK